MNTKLIVYKPITQLKSLFNWSFMTSTFLYEKNRTESSAYNNKSHIIWLVSYHLHIKEKAEAPKWNPEKSPESE